MCLCVLVCLCGLLFRCVVFKCSCLSFLWYCLFRVCLCVIARVCVFFLLGGALLVFLNVCSVLSGVVLCAFFICGLAALVVCVYFVVFCCVCLLCYRFVVFVVLILCV